MTLVDLRTLDPTLSSRVAEAKEGLVDALLNITSQRASGDGVEGDVVFGAKPSLRFVSGFLLPRYDDTGTEDETSDIHLSTHGLDCQLVAGQPGTATVNIGFAIYVRALPTWQELVDPSFDLFPNPPLRKELEVVVRDTMKMRLAATKAEDASRPLAERRDYRVLQQDLYHAVLSEHGVRISEGGIVTDLDSAAAPVAADSSDVLADPSTADDNGRIVAQRGRYIFANDAAAQEQDVPQKWMRLRVPLDPLDLDLSDTSARDAAVSSWTVRARAAVAETVRTWLSTDQGRDFAYRPAAIRPSHVRNEAAWNALLSDLRRSLPALQDIAPNLDGLFLNIGISPDLRDADRSNLRVIIENNSADVSPRRRHRFEHAIHQVSLRLALPAGTHRPLRLDRVEASYRFRDFLTYPAIGVNCGVTSTTTGDYTHLATTWMPRYTQPRIAPRHIAGVPTRFDTLSRSGFDPERLRPLVETYGSWIDEQERSIDPTEGAATQEDATRERDAFRADLGSYRQEAGRIALGIDLLTHSFRAFQDAPESGAAVPYRAWLLLNETFADSGRLRGIEDWRLFQLAFVLAHVPTLSSRMSAYNASPWFDPAFDEETATLLYFPTGGGKSEAFFGLLVFNLFLDRLRGKSTGVTALLRYPLRLLTLQQAQRLLAIVMRAELIRLAHNIAGSPFEIGFWVGSGNTPNRSDDSRLEPVPALDDPRHLDDSRPSSAYAEVNQSFNKTPSCPLCRQDTGLRRAAHGSSGEIVTVCFNVDCRWNRETHGAPLPFLIVDRDIYRHAPAVILGVIDKLALIGQHPATINRVMGMFGFARWRERSTGHFIMPLRAQLKAGAAASQCDPVAPAYHDGVEAFHDPFPSLVIQDEAHLLEESLGTFAGLFETLLEQLFVRGAALLGDRVARSPFGSKPARMPKIIAATATVSVPQQQFGALYQRRHMHFPFPGTSIYRSFYAEPAPPPRPERRGLGGTLATASEIEAPWMRVYASLMTNGRNHTVTTVAVLAAFHLAITELWSDLLDESRRGGAVARTKGALTPDAPLRRFHESALDACADADPAILPTLLDLMRISLTYVTNKKGGDQVIDAFREEVVKTHARHGRPLTQLHTRLVSGGVDVAQIQEIMRDAEGLQRPGDDFPDLEQSLRNIVATSAISHGVDVDKFNAMFFAGMPSDIAEFIQASSRVGRAHVGFCLLVPTPHARRDRYIVETHDVFHRFLERMIAPPAITRWAASAHDRVLTSVFQAWLCGWAEQTLFCNRDDADKERAPIFETVNDVNRLLTGTELPGAARDFMDFAVAAIGVPGRGVRRWGAAPHHDYYDGRIRNLAKLLTDELRTLQTTTRLNDYWDGAAVGTRPMMSLRDIDEAGHFQLARPFGTGRRMSADDERETLAGALRIVRRQSGRVSELDSEEGER